MRPTNPNVFRKYISFDVLEYMRDLNSSLVVFLYFKKSDMKGTAFNLSLFWQICNGHCNLFGNILLKTCMNSS